MRQSVMQVVDIAGTPIACYQIESIQGLAQVYKGRLFSINSRGLAEHTSNSKYDDTISQKYRFVLAENADEARALARVEPMKCYLRDQNMNAQVLNLNPYQSVGYLRQLAQGQRKGRVKLVINEKDLTDDSESLLKYIHEDAIIHVIEVIESGSSHSIAIYTKEPGADSVMYKFENLFTSDLVETLLKAISRKVSIPEQFLYLVYGGKILLKDRPLSDYYIQNNACMYAVDSRKYMRKIPVEEYHRRMAQMKRVKECNRLVSERAKAQRHENTSGERKQGQNKYTYERSGTIMEDLGDDNQYFKEGKMSLESEQFAEFERRGNKLQQSAKLQVQAANIKKVNSELEHGRIVTNSSQVYQDDQGFTHEVSREKSVFRNGYKTVDVNITQDDQGNIISIEQDIVNVKKNSLTGYTIKQQTDIIEDFESNKTVVRKEEIRDKNGNVVRYETSKHTENQRANDEGTLAVNSRASQHPQTSQERLVEVDQQGNIRTCETQLLEKEGRTVFVKKDVTEDPEGNLIAVKTGVVQIQGDSDGNVHKHKSEIVEIEGRVTMVETNEVIDAEGIVIAKQKDEINIEEGQDGSIVKKQTNVVEQDDCTKIVKRGVVEDYEGNIIKTSTKTIHIENSEYGIRVHQQQQTEQLVEGDGQQGTVQKQVEVVQDETGNKITQEREFVETEGGQPTLISTITVENTEGEIVSQKTEELKINQDSEIERYTTKYAQNENKIVIAEGKSVENMDGSVIRSEKETFQIEENEDGSLLKSKTAVTEEDGIKTIHIKKQLQDAEGRLIKKSSDIYELETANRGNMMLTSSEAPIYVANVEKSALNRVYNVDQDGHLVVSEKEVRREQGIENITQREVVYDEEGNVVSKQTEIKENFQMGNGETRYTIADIVEQGNLTTVIETNTLFDEEGNKIRTEQGTMQIEKMHGGLTRKEKQTVIEESGVKVKVHKEAYEDDEGNILQEEVKTTEAPKDGESGNDKIVSQVFKRKIEEVEQDESGNYVLHEREVQQNNDGDSLVVESQVLRSEDHMLRATTDVVEENLQQDGTVYKRQVNIIEKPGKVTVAESDSLLDASGDKIKGQVSSVVMTQGPNNELITKQTTIYVDGLQKRIVEETIVEDQFGNVTHAKGKAKRIEMDEHGVEQSREEEKYEATVQQIQGGNIKEGYTQVSREIVQDADGNVVTLETNIVENQQEGTSIIKSEKLENSKGEIVGLNTKVVEIQNLEHGTITRQQNEEVFPDKIIKGEMLTISDREGTILSEKQKKIEISENQGLVRTSKTGTVRRQGETTVGIVETLQDEDGNIIDQSSNVMKIRDSEDALREHARKVANAEMSGQVKSVVRQYADDEEGNRHMIEKQIIEGQGSTITVNTRTIQTPQGELIQAKTAITQQKIENGVVSKYQTQIIEEGGQVQVVEFAEASSSSGSNQLGYSGQLSGGASQQLEELLGFNQSQPIQARKMEVKLTNSINESDLLQQSHQQFNLLDLGGSGSEIKAFRNEVPVYEATLPEEFQIVAIDKQRNQTRIRVRYDENLDEVARRLADILGRPSGRIQFYKDGNELPEYDLISDYDIGPGDQLYFTIDHEK